MEDIYSILSRYFLNETTLEENSIVADFKEKNPVEFKLLSTLWKRDSIEVIDFDTQNAWNIITKKQTKPNSSKIKKIIPLWSFLKIAGSIAAIFLIGLFVYTESFSKKATVKIEQVLETNQDERAKIVHLSDGSAVWLNKNATLSYPKYFGELMREVYLEGEAFFDISKNTAKPFVVNTINSSIQVLGTSFNVNANHENTRVSVTTGKVKVSNSDKSKSKLITPNFSAVVGPKQINVSETKNKNYLAWKTGCFIFDQSPLKQVIADLRMYYPDTLLIDYKTNPTCNFTATFKKDKLQDILEVMRITCGFKLIKNQGKYLIQ